MDEDGEGGGGVGGRARDRTAQPPAPPRPDPGASPPSSSSDDDSDFDEVDASDADVAAIERLEAALAADPSAYDAHVEASGAGGGAGGRRRAAPPRPSRRPCPSATPAVPTTHTLSLSQYIATLKRCRMGARLESARRAMADRYPLPEGLWLDWLADAAAAAAKGEVSRDAVTALFDAAVGDYLSIPVWRAYLGFAAAGAVAAAFTPEGGAAFREVASRALAAGGLHVGAGDALWDAVIAYEVAALAAHSGGPDQAERVRALHHRRLRSS